MSEQIEEWRMEQAKALMEQQSSANKKARQIIKAKGKNSREFWRLANRKEEEEINAFREKRGTSPNPLRKH